MASSAASSRSVEIPAIVSSTPKVYLAMAMEQLAEHAAALEQPVCPGISLRMFNPDEEKRDREPPSVVKLEYSRKR